MFPMDDQAKVNLVGHYMWEKADLWYMEYVEGRMVMSWRHFCELLLARFTPTGKEDVLIEFSNLFYETDIETYLEMFEELKAFEIPCS